LGKVYRNLMVDLQVTCAKLQDRGERILMETLGMERHEAEHLLVKAGGHVKSGIVMGRLGVGREEAERLLKEAGGQITRVVGDLE
jgi:N-acetylmuramic acid 6-phosphate etherase